MGAAVVAGTLLGLNEQQTVVQTRCLALLDEAAHINGYRSAVVCVVIGALHRTVVEWLGGQVQRQ